MTITTESLETLAALSLAVAAEAAEAEAADKALEAAQAELFATVIKLVRPSVRAIGGRPRTSFCSHWIGTSYTDDRVTRADYSAVIISDDEAGPGRRNSDQNRGSYNGFDLFLKADGTLVQYHYEGSWSHWQGEGGGWSVEETTYSTPAEAISDGWTYVEGYIERLTARLKAYVGNGKESAQTDRKRAEQLNALAQLMK